LFDRQPDRSTAFQAQAADITLDYSKNRLTSETLRQLFDLARACDIEALRDAMFAGQTINTTERQPALHTALRRPFHQPLAVDGQDIMPQIEQVHNQMVALSATIRENAYLGATGKPIASIVNIGIGGSDLGPLMAYEALKGYGRQNLRFHFVSNIDSSHLHEALEHCDPETTLCIVASKTFTTDETITNATSAKQWLLESLHDKAAVSKHFAAVTANPKAAQEFGISPKQTFEIWDWIGGRYSLPSAMGLSLMIAIGPDNFDQLLAGMHAIDEHFIMAPLERNLPVILGLIDIWNINFWNTQNLAILPYCQSLQYLSSYLQQLIMESNGKSVTRTGQAVTYSTAPVVFGVPGTNSQHSINQLLQQGTQVVPADFIGFKEPLVELGNHHAKLQANLTAQAQALAFGETSAQEPYRQFAGNRPSNTLMLPRLTPHTLGQLIALYEHRVFVQGAIWDIDSFDQWGVELGKQLARQLLRMS
jgi:glucose-6-phosphate isomerase